MKVVLGKLDSRDMRSAILSLLEKKIGLLRGGWVYSLGPPQHGGVAAAYKEYDGRIWIQEYLGDVYVEDGVAYIVK